MNSIKNIINIYLFLAVVLLSFSCEDLTEANINPNGVDPSEVHPNELMSTVMSGLGVASADLGYAGSTGNTMQYTQKDSWEDNDYGYSGSNSWSTYYDLLRTNQLASDRAVELNLEFHQGVTKVLNAMLFGTLADFYGDVPFSEALMGGDEDNPNIFPKYDTQKDVYDGIIAELKAAANLLSKDVGSYDEINSNQDIFYQGDPTKWRKLANSLQLRYYMRISNKVNVSAEITTLLNEPLITSADDDCVLPFPGTGGDDSWPQNGATNDDDFYRVKPCATLTTKLVELNDPRAVIWFQPVVTPTEVVAVLPPGVGDGEIENGIRYFDQANLVGDNRTIFDQSTFKADRLAGLVLIDVNPVYVGLPVSVSGGELYKYNINTTGFIGAENDFVSTIHDDFNARSGPNLKARLLSAAEVHFLMAEAALTGIAGSNPQSHYEMGIQASLDAWNIGSEYDNYIVNAGVTYDGSLDQIAEQRWIANFVNGTEAWFDWRRTGLPAYIEAGPFANRDAIPLRFIYNSTDASINDVNYRAALENLEGTSFSTGDVDSKWSYMWLMQDGDAPW